MMVPIPIWATTPMVQNETVYINIYIKLKNIFSNSNIYFAAFIHYTIYIYILLYYIYYIYINRVFQTGG